MISFFLSEIIYGKLFTFLVKGDNLILKNIRRFRGFWNYEWVQNGVSYELRGLFHKTIPLTYPGCWIIKQIIGVLVIDAGLCGVGQIDQL